MCHYLGVTICITLPICIYQRQVYVCVTTYQRQECIRLLFHVPPPHHHVTREKAPTVPYQPLILPMPPHSQHLLQCVAVCCSVSQRHTHTHTHAHTHKDTHTHTHAHAHAYVHAYTHTHTHTHNTSEVYIIEPAQLLLQRTAMHYNALQRTATQRTAMHYNALQCTATRCNALQRNALQRTATHCNTLQHNVTKI